MILELDNGKVPFEIWHSRLDLTLQQAVDARLTRIANGNFGDHRSIGGGVFELRIPKGPGLRIYYGVKQSELIILIGGGDKRTQRKDIAKAKELWKRYENED